MEEELKIKLREKKQELELSKQYPFVYSIIKREIAVLNGIIRRRELKNE
jgi:hypothetical protein|tara:strand:- start:15286 stop:15432 length:147 start_codon:yes stop_codon:yes gene_type:complete